MDDLEHACQKPSESTWLTTTQAPDAPLDVLGAESEGQIGYLLETALSEALPDSEVSSLPALRLSTSWYP